jgi:hypothetical protein
LENEVAISPASLLELKFLLIIVKEGKVIATVPKISCNKNKIILMQFFCFHCICMKGVSSVVPLSRIMEHIFISVNMKVHSIMGSLSEGRFSFSLSEISQMCVTSFDVLKAYSQ